MRKGEREVEGEAREIEIQRKGEREIEGEERGTETGRKGKKVEKRYFYSYRYYCLH